MSEEINIRQNDEYFDQNAQDGVLSDSDLPNGIAKIEEEVVAQSPIIDVVGPISDVVAASPGVVPSQRADRLESFDWPLVGASANRNALVLNMKRSIDVLVDVISITSNLNLYLIRSLQGNRQALPDNLRDLQTVRLELEDIIASLRRTTPQIVSNVIPALEQPKPSGVSGEQEQRPAEPIQAFARMPYPAIPPHNNLSGAPMTHRPMRPSNQMPQQFIHPPPSQQLHGQQQEMFWRPAAGIVQAPLQHPYMNSGHLQCYQPYMPPITAPPQQFVERGQPQMLHGNRMHPYNGNQRRDMNQAVGESGAGRVIPVPPPIITPSPIFGILTMGTTGFHVFKWDESKVFMNSFGRMTFKKETLTLGKYAETFEVKPSDTEGAVYKGYAPVGRLLIIEDPCLVFLIFADRDTTSEVDYSTHNKAMTKVGDFALPSRNFHVTERFVVILRRTIHHFY